MLRSLKDLKARGIEMKNGDKRQIKDFLADDIDMKVRYITVETEKWLPGRTVMVSTQTVGRPEGNNELPVNLTTDQITKGPIREKDKPIDREFEQSLSGYYNWTPYWSTEGRAKEGRTQNLISMSEVMKYHINALDGEIGHAEDLIVDDADWTIRYIVVDASNWNPMAKRTLISRDWVTDLDMRTKQVDINVNKDQVKDAPQYNSGDVLKGPAETKLHEKLHHAGVPF